MFRYLIFLLILAISRMAPAQSSELSAVDIVKIREWLDSPVVVEGTFEYLDKILVPNINLQILTYRERFRLLYTLLQHKKNYPIAEETLAKNDYFKDAFSEEERKMNLVDSIHQKDPSLAMHYLNSSNLKSLNKKELQRFFTLGISTGSESLVRKLLNTSPFKELLDSKKYSELGILEKNNKIHADLEYFVIGTNIKELVEIFLKYGMNPNELYYQSSPTKLYPLKVAILEESFISAQTLIENGAVFNADFWSAVPSHQIRVFTSMSPEFLDYILTKKALSINNEVLSKIFQSIVATYGLDVSLESTSWEDLDRYIEVFFRSDTHEVIKNSRKSRRRNDRSYEADSVFNFYLLGLTVLSQAFKANNFKEDKYATGKRFFILLEYIHSILEKKGNAWYKTSSGAKEVLDFHKSFSHLIKKIAIDTASQLNEVDESANIMHYILSMIQNKKEESLSENQALANAAKLEMQELEDIKSAIAKMNPTYAKTLENFDPEKLKEQARQIYIRLNQL